MEWWQAAVAAVGGAVALFVTWRVASAKASRAVTENRAEEWQKLAEARDERIGELEGKVARLQSELEVLRGQMAALEGLKAKEIAAEVASLLHQSFAIAPRGLP